MNAIIKAASRLAIRPIKDHVLLCRPLVGQFVTPKKWAHNCPLTYDFARERIMLVLRLYDKIDPEKLTLESHFVNDLGLDSLDHTDIIMTLEDEFNFEIPDKDAEKLLRPSDILRYITDKEEAYEELQELQKAAHHDHHHDEHHPEPGSFGHVDPDRFRNPVRDFSTSARRYTNPFSDDERKKKTWATSFYEAPAKQVNFDEIQDRVMKVCAKYDKIDSSKLQLHSHFVDDLGLDSLDHVEIMMELEDEFSLEIPDQDAEKLLRPTEIARYVFQKEEARAVKQEDRPL